MLYYIVVRVCSQICIQRVKSGCKFLCMDTYTCVYAECDNSHCDRYTLTNKHKVALEVISIGARVNKMVTTGGDDIVLGFNSEPGDDITGENTR